MAIIMPLAAGGKHPYRAGIAILAFAKAKIKQFKKPAKGQMSMKLL